MPTVAKTTTKNKRNLNSLHTIWFLIVLKLEQENVISLNSRLSIQECWICALRNLTQYGLCTASKDAPLILNMSEKTESMDLMCIKHGANWRL